MKVYNINVRFIRYLFNFLLILISQTRGCPSIRHVTHSVYEVSKINSCLDNIIIERFVFINDTNAKYENTWSARFHRTRFARFAVLPVAHHSLGTSTTPWSVGCVAALCSRITIRRVAVATRSRGRRRRRKSRSVFTCIRSTSLYSVKIVFHS